MYDERADYCRRVDLTARPVSATQIAFDRLAVFAVLCALLTLVGAVVRGVWL